MHALKGKGMLKFPSFLCHQMPKMANDGKEGKRCGVPLHIYVPSLWPHIMCIRISKSQSRWAKKRCLFNLRTYHPNETPISYGSKKSSANKPCFNKGGFAKNICCWLSDFSFIINNH